MFGMQWNSSSCITILALTILSTVRYGAHSNNSKQLVFSITCLQKKDEGSLLGEIIHLDCIGP